MFGLLWASCQIRKIEGCACAGNAGKDSPRRRIRRNTARASRTCRDACRNRLPTVAGKTFPAFPAHAHPQFYLSGKRPMGTNVNMHRYSTWVRTLSNRRQTISRIKMTQSTEAHMQRHTWLTSNRQWIDQELFRWWLIFSGRSYNRLQQQLIYYLLFSVKIRYT